MKKSFWFGFCFLSFLILAAIFSKWISPYELGIQNLSEQLSSASLKHLLGQNQNGEDVLTLLIHGSRISLLLGFLTVLSSLFLGTVMGLISGYFRGAIDQFFSRLIDMIQAFPGILLAMFISAVLPPSFWNVVISLSVSGWIPFARLIRGQVISLREREFIIAVQSLGASSFRILFHHLLPNLAGLLIVQVSFSFAQMILSESSLSFLGLGVPIGTPSWGKVLSDGARYLISAPHLATFPGVVIMLTVLSLNLVGEGLKERFSNEK